MKTLLCALALLVAGAGFADAACTGSSPNLSAPDTGNPTTNGTNFQACITAAALGDTIKLDPGVEYRGNFTFPGKGAGTSFITIQPTSLAPFPAGTRVTASQAGSMAKLTTATTTPVISLLTDAHHYQFIALEITTTGDLFAAGQTAPRIVGQDDTITYSHWPDSIVFDRVLVHPHETDPLPYRAANTGISIDGSNITFKNSAIYDFRLWDSPSVERTLTAATNASPVKITTTGTLDNPGHKFLMYLQGATAGWTVLNGLKVASWVSTNEFTLEDYDSSFTLTPVNTGGSGSFAGQAVSQMSLSVSQTNALLIQIGPGPYTITNNLLEAYFTPIFSGGSGGTWIDPNHQATVSAVNSISQVVLNSVTDLQVGDLIAFSSTQDQTISAAVSNGAGNGTRLTVQTHRFPASTSLYPEGFITISGFTGAWAGLNGNWGGFGNSAGQGGVLTVDTTHIDVLAFDSSGLGAATFSSPKWVATVKDNTGFKQWHVGKVTNISGTTVDFDWWGHQPENTGGNGAGILIASGATVQYRGRNLDTLSVTQNTFQNRRDWIWLIRDVAKTCDNCGTPPKACWEAKSGDNVTIEGNTLQIDGGDLDPKGGTVCLAINQASQIGSTPWISVNNWIIRSNLFKNYTYQKFSLKEEYESGLVSGTLLFHNNLMTKTNASFINLEGADAVTVTHNTSRNFGTGSSSSGGSNDYMTIFGTPNTNSLVRDNIGLWVTYGYNALDAWPSPTRDHNYLIDNQSTGEPGLPAGDHLVADDASMGFVDVTSADAGGDYHGYKLTSGSVGHNAASDGTDVGVNFTTLDAALGGTSPPPATPPGHKLKLKRH